ncbi:MAG TPA: SpoIIE family protein phosphatase, partial [Isosphaeraceae bacterium]|nr:SpoIIE family protein phosphatase [Isosphaeraceae bacterium]
VWSESRKHPALEGMGATLVLALLRDCQALIAHAGDSRAYLLRQGEFRQMTRDHTPVQRLLDEGKITLRESADHPQAGLLSRYLGMSQDIAVDVSFLDLEPSDRLLLCSDGVTTPLTAAEIHGILELGQPPEETCRFLIDAANLRGGEDNATAVLVALESSPRANKTTSRIRLPALRDPS